MKEITAELMPVCDLPRLDAESFAEWIWPLRITTNFDPQTLGYPRACMAKASRGEETLAMVPLHPFLMMESLAHKPGIPDSALILALSAIDKALGAAMRDTGMCEAYFLTSNKRFADTCKAHGWQRVLFDRKRKTWLMKKVQCA